jgi:HD domain
MTGLLEHPVSQDLFALWEEYERQESYEARVVRAIDKLEAQLQHNEADLSTWLAQEKEMVFQAQWTHAFCAFDSALAQLSDGIRTEARAKLAADEAFPSNRAGKGERHQPERTRTVALIIVFLEIGRLGVVFSTCASRRCWVSGGAGMRRVNSAPHGPVLQGCHRLRSRSHPSL